MEDSGRMLTVTRPSPLRLWGFLLTVLGGALIAFGSIGTWAAVSLGNSTQNAVPTKGVDVWQGTVTLLLGVLIVLGILALRFVPPRGRRVVAAGITVAAVLALAFGAWALGALGSIVRDSGIEGLTRMAEQAGVPASRAAQLVRQTLDRFGIEVRAQAGLWITLAGGALALAGGAVDLAWVRQKRQLGTAIDPDTLPEDSATER